jgi:hypothetical protein
MDLIRDALRPSRAAADDGGSAPVRGSLLDQVIEQVRELNGGDLDDDLAVLALGYSPGR